MSKNSELNPKTYSRPERVLLVLARTAGDCRGKALRFRDNAEFRFESLGELAAWLTAGEDVPPVSPPEEPTTP